MRTQSGTTSLRALVYFDEIFGYMPPTANPPSKQPMLRMLKQARAFGVGLVLVTQNPVDVDYKGLSNTGTWFIGKLQTDQDKQRLLDGLEGVAAGSMDRAAYDKIISGLAKRVFLLHNVHSKGPVSVPDPLGDELPGRTADPHPDPAAQCAGRRIAGSRPCPGALNPHLLGDKRARQLEADAAFPSSGCPAGRCARQHCRPDVCPAARLPASRCRPASASTSCPTT